MDEQQIRAATPDQLRVMVAEALGWKWMRLNFSDGLTLFAPAAWGEKMRAGAPLWVPSTPDAPRHEGWEAVLPDWPNDISAAWSLDGERWLWEFGEADDVLGVGVVAKGAFSVFESWRETKPQTYATARCRVWLLAREAQ